MNQAKKAFLISPLHDPQGTYLGVIQEKGSPLAKYYSLVILGVTDATHPKTLTALRNLNFILLQSNYPYGEGYRQALNEGLKRGGCLFHCADLDRILHWASTYPNELQKTLKKAHTTDYIILAQSSEPSFSTLAEWPLLVKRAGLKVDYFAVEGYEWEDPDRFQKEIKKMDYQKWLENYYNTREWKKC